MLGFNMIVCCAVLAGSLHAECLNYAKTSNEKARSALAKA